MRKLAIVTTHPIQYNAPLFRYLQEGGQLQIKVFYTWSQSNGPIFDKGFGIVRNWDIPLLEGYDFQFVENIAEDPGTHHFKGIDNPTLIPELKKFQPNAIIVFGWNFKSHLRCLRYFKGKVPILFRGDSTLLDESGRLRKLLRRIFLTWVYKHIDYALYVGENNRAYFLAHGLKLRQLIFAPHAIDNDRFKKNAIVAEQEAKSIRRKLGLAENTTLVLFAGKFEEKKDPECVLRIAKKLTNQNLQFLFVGNGVLELKLKQLAASDNRIHFMDFQNQQVMPAIYRMADIFILPSIRNETWGLAINEAMCCSRPIIASNKVGCVPDIVIDGVNGWVFEPGEIGEQKLLSRLEMLPEESIVLKKMGEHGFKQIDKYSYKTIRENINTLMETIP